MWKNVHIIYKTYGENPTSNNNTYVHQLIVSSKMRKSLTDSHLTGKNRSYQKALLEFYLHISVLSCFRFQQYYSNSRSWNWSLSSQFVLKTALF